MPNRTSSPPGQNDIPRERALTIIEAKQAEVVHAFNSEAKINLMRGLLGGDQELFEHFRAVALHNIARNKDLLEKCTVESIFDALRQAAEVKLEVTGILGEGYLIEQKGQATFQAGYRGLMKLARRSGLVDSIDCHMVFERDQFAIQLGTNPAIVHNPEPFGDRGQYIGVYAWARLRTGDLIIEPLSMADIEKVRKASRFPTGPYSPWTNWFEEMARKTALKRLMKRLPLGEDGESLMRYEAQYENEVAEDKKTADIDRLRQSALAALPGATGGELGPGAPTGTVPPTDGQGDTTTGGGDGAECPADGCVRGAHEPTVNHRNADGETWAAD